MLCEPYDRLHIQAPDAEAEAGHFVVCMEGHGIEGHIVDQIFTKSTKYYEIIICCVYFLDVFQAANFAGRHLY